MFKKSVADMPEAKILKTIFEGDFRDVEKLLHIRNKVCECSVFSEDEKVELSDLILDVAQEDGAITWDEDVGDYILNSDGTPISQL